MKSECSSNLCKLEGVRPRGLCYMNSVCLTAKKLWVNISLVPLPSLTMHPEETPQLLSSFSSSTSYQENPPVLQAPLVCKTGLLLIHSAATRHKSIGCCGVSNHHSDHYNFYFFFHFTSSSLSPSISLPFIVPPHLPSPSPLSEWRPCLDIPDPGTSSLCKDRSFSH